MELVKIIFESFGSREMERIFRNYFLLTLLLKQFVFSLFSNPVDLFEIPSVQPEIEQISGDHETGESPEEGWNEFSTFQFMFTLAQLEPDPVTAPDKSFNKNQ